MTTHITITDLSSKRQVSFVATQPIKIGHKTDPVTMKVIWDKFEIVTDSTCIINCLGLHEIEMNEPSFPELVTAKTCDIISVDTFGINGKVYKKILINPDTIVLSPKTTNAVSSIKDAIKAYDAAMSIVGKR